MTSMIWGVGCALVLWTIAAVTSRRWDPQALFRGTDGRPSTSKLQFLLWFAALLVSYVSVLAAATGDQRWRLNVLVPQELLVAMGLAAATLVTAKGITVTQINRGRIEKTNTPNGGPSYLVSDDIGDLDVSKAQMLIWTLVVIGVYLARVADALRSPPAGRVVLPSVEPSLVALLGIGQAVYLGHKLVTTEVPRLTGLSPPSGRAPLPLTIVGGGMGEKEGASLTLDGMPVATFVTTWSSQRIEVTLPATRPDGTPWPRDRAVSIGLITGGRISANTLPFTFA